MLEIVDSNIYILIQQQKQLSKERYLLGKGYFEQQLLVSITAEAYSGFIQRSKMELFAKKNNGCR